MAKCNKCDYPYAVEGKNCPSCGTMVNPIFEGGTSKGLFQSIDIGSGTAKERRESKAANRVSESKKLKEFSYVGRGISDLNELFDSKSDEELFEIEILDLSNNNITDISPLIRLFPPRKGAKLKELYLSGNMIEYIPDNFIDLFTGPFKLYKIDFSNNRISNLPKNFSKLFHFKLDLNLENNQITNFPRIEFDLEQTKKQALHYTTIKFNLNNNPLDSINENLLDFLVKIQTAFDIPKVTFMPYNEPLLSLILPEKLIEEKEKLFSIQKNFETDVPNEVLEYVRKEVKSDITDLSSSTNTEMLNIAFKYYDYFNVNHGANIKFGSIDFKTSTNVTKYRSAIKSTGKYIQGKFGSESESVKYIEQKTSTKVISLAFYKNIDVSTWINHHLHCSIDLKHFIMDEDFNFIYRDNQSEIVLAPEEGSILKGLFNLALVALLVFGIFYGLYKLITLIF